MEPSVFCSPYLKATSRDSLAIREQLDRQEAEYVAWRRNRKPIRHPFASAKLNSPHKGIVEERQQAAAKPLWLALLEPTELFEDGTRATSSSSSNSQRHNSTSSSPNSRPSTRGGVPTPSASTPLLPSLQRLPDRLGTAASLASVQTRSGTHSPQFPHRKKPSAAKRHLQKHLYDFHSSIVFSVASDDATEPTTLPPVDGPSSPRVDIITSISSSPEPEVAIIELPAPEQDDQYVLSGLGVVDASCFDSVFESDWANSEVDRIVRDAVERKRIKAILKHWYRVLLLYFRQYAGKTALTKTSPTSAYFAVDLQQIPSQLSLLEDLNVQCVDPAKFGITETPLRRDGLITFITHAAKMVAMHSPNPTAFRMFAAEGIEMSEAVRSLMVDHVAVYAQIQDADHFRNVFLVDRHDRQGRRLLHILAKHEATLSSFFFESITTAGTTVTTTNPAANGQRRRSDSYHRLQASSTTMNFHAFVMVLKALSIVPTAGTDSRKRRPTVSSGAEDGGAATKSTVVTLDENRAMRIFQQCLDVTAEFGSAAVPSKQQLTYPQFVEALLRVTLMRHETSICGGGLDICPGQQTSDVCSCESPPPTYDLAAFDDTLEAFLGLIQVYRLRRSSRCSSLKMMSIQSLQKVRPRHHALVVPPDNLSESSPERSEADSI